MFGATKRLLDDVFAGHRVFHRILTKAGAQTGVYAAWQRAYLSLAHDALVRLCLCVFGAALLLSAVTCFVVCTPPCSLLWLPARI